MAELAHSDRGFFDDWSGVAGGYIVVLYIQRDHALDKTDRRLME